MESENNIEHVGVVVSISAKHLEVEIINKSACSGCNVKGLCSASEQKRKVVDVVVENDSDYKLGQEVVLYGSVTLGFKAVAIAYVLPLIILLLSIVICNVSGISDALSGLISICILIPYFLLLYIFRRRLQKTFIFKTKNLIN